MAYCPDCLTEYVEGTVKCMDCGVALQPGSPPARASEERADAKLVRLRTFSGPTAQLNADLARNLLQQEGIRCILPGERSAVLPGADVVQLLVRDEDARRAAEILEAFLGSSEGAPTA